MSSVEGQDDRNAMERDPGMEATRKAEQREPPPVARASIENLAAEGAGGSKATPPPSDEVQAPAGSKEPYRRYTLKEVIAAEGAWLERHRPAKKVKGSVPQRWGLCLSGGGIRSATFSLGVLQSLIRAELLRLFDYLSTVSGGGYIGSCLSSLLTARDDDPRDGASGPGGNGATDYPDPRREAWGVEPGSSPFVGLGEETALRTPYLPAAGTPMTVLHQLHHLRTHGEYLTPRTRFLTRDVQRAVGVVFTGLLYTVGLFLLALVTVVAGAHVVLSKSGIDPDLDLLAPAERFPQIAASGLVYLKEVGQLWLSDRFAPPLAAMWRSAGEESGLVLWSFVVGLLWGVFWLLRAKRTAKTLAKGERDPWFSPKKVRAGYTLEEATESLFLRRFNVWSVLVVVAWSLGATWWRGWWRGLRESFLGAFLLPLAFAAGGALWVFLASSLAESRRASHASRESRQRRSLYWSVAGAASYGIAGALLAPIVVSLVFSLADLPGKVYLSALSVGAGYLLSRRRARGEGLPTAARVRWQPLIATAVGVFLVLSAAKVSAMLVILYRSEPGLPVWAQALVVFLTTGVLFLFLGLLINPNRVSLHYFYRDRLSEAYLRTDARVRRGSDDPNQGRPLVTLRSNARLALKDLGEGNFTAPYHLVVAALNLSSSDELARKDLRSQHFLFSPLFVGSEVTGYRETARYRAGETKLARAMTISAAAVSSAIGYHTSWGQAFLATLFNARLGYWMENPWFPSSQRLRSRCFWPLYLLYEMFSTVDARKRLVNLSDGGHTGDNLGLLPLLERRCDVVVVVDGEADPSLHFGSFNNAVRLAFIERNIRIDIDLGPVMRKEEVADGYPLSEASVVVGKICYPKVGEGEDLGEKEGTLIYIKASASARAAQQDSSDQAASGGSADSEDGAQDLRWACRPPSGLPPQVISYLKEHPKFPHEPTADQYFDDAQFEAYRALGEELGARAAVPLGDKEIVAGGAAEAGGDSGGRP